nr:MAG TPA: hypothetical protein [Bacteriophage sp.]
MPPLEIAKRFPPFVTLFYLCLINKRGVGHFCLPLQFYSTILSCWIIFAERTIYSS